MGIQVSWVRAVLGDVRADGPFGLRDRGRRDAHSGGSSLRRRRAIAAGCLGLALAALLGASTMAEQDVVAPPGHPDGVLIDRSDQGAGGVRPNSTRWPTRALASTRPASTSVVPAISSGWSCSSSSRTPRVMPTTGSA